MNRVRRIHAYVLPVWAYDRPDGNIGVLFLTPQESNVIPNNVSSALMMLGLFRPTDLARANQETNYIMRLPSNRSGFSKYLPDPSSRNGQNGNGNSDHAMVINQEYGFDDFFTMWKPIERLPENEARLVKVNLAERGHIILRDVHTWESQGQRYVMGNVDFSDNSNYRLDHQVGLTIDKVKTIIPLEIAPEIQAELTRLGVPAETNPKGDGAMNATPGGIDMNSTIIHMNVQRDGKGIEIPVSQLTPQNFKIDGLVPVIINVTPIPNLPLLLGWTETPPQPSEQADRKKLSPMDRFKGEPLVSRL